jgi:hypothetical protein
MCLLENLCHVCIPGSSRSLASILEIQKILTKKSSGGQQAKKKKGGKNLSPRQYDIFSFEKSSD